MCGRSIGKKTNDLKKDCEIKWFMSIVNRFQASNINQSDKGVRPFKPFTRLQNWDAKANPV